MAILKYPDDLDENQNDYIQFDHYEYKLNDDEKLNDFTPKRPGGKTIRLYMPNSTPAAHYGHDAKYQTFPGPLGQLGKQVQKTLGKNFDGETAAESIDGIIKGFADKDYGGAAYQFGLEQAAGFFGSDAATALALGQQKFFNPNAEMIYKQPLHRKYNFSFDFVPKSRDEAVIVDEIIYEFKSWSAPSFDDGSQFMNIPDLWRITYHEASGKIYRRMNLFKPSMIMNFVVQDNPMSDFHITIKDEINGHVPVHTAINIFFQETQPPTRKDHKDALGRGQVRGY